MSAKHPYNSVTTSSQLAELCEAISTAHFVGLDTEFVSEDSFHPHLCLVQLAIDGELWVVDTIELPEVDSMWDLLTQGSHKTLVHAAREEFLFAWRASGRPLANLIDMQIGAGLVGLEHPASYGNLVNRLVGASVGKGETRTDWRRRPLSTRQIDYALVDVIHLLPMWEELKSRLDRLDRLPWLDEEMQLWQDNLIESVTQARWRRVSGISGLSPRSMAIVRELWHWRQEEAERRDKPPKRVLRDDLIIEMAKRKTADVKRLKAVRGMHHRGVQDYLPEFASRIQAALDLPDSELPRSSRGTPPPQLTVLGQFLNVALAAMCRRGHVAPSLVGTVQDVRDLVTHHLELAPNRNGEIPRLAQGWRDEVVGNLIEEMLAGKLSIRIGDPLANCPLIFDKNSGDET